MRDIGRNVGRQWYDSPFPEGLKCGSFPVFGSDEASRTNVVQCPSVCCELHSDQCTKKHTPTG